MICTDLSVVGKGLEVGPNSEIACSPNKHTEFALIDRFEGCFS